jgi:hypothetical protein
MTCYCERCTRERRRLRVACIRQERLVICAKILCSSVLFVIIVVLLRRICIGGPLWP